MSLTPEDDNVEGLAAAATRHLQSRKQKEKAVGSCITKNIMGKLLIRVNIILSTIEFNEMNTLNFDSIISCFDP
jgi:hypothetical protein